MPLLGLLAHRARDILCMVFGELSWQPPSWSRTAYGASRQRGAELAAAIRRAPRRAATLAGAVLVVLSAASYGWYWYATRPTPEVVTFNVGQIDVPCYACQPAR